jgi:LysM repeat protein
MEKRTSAFARIFAALALVGAVVVVIVVIGAASGGDSGNSDDRKSNQAAKQKKQPRTKAKTYVIQSEDTLIAISRKTGISVAELRVLNPEIDPQILIAGEVLKLR